MSAIPYVVTSGWTRSDFIANTLGDTYRLLTYPNGDVAFEHRCDRSASSRGVIICAPRLRIGQGHTLTRNDKGEPTVRASILCEDCSTHGFITDGRWHS